MRKIATIFAISLMIGISCGTPMADAQETPQSSDITPADGPSNFDKIHDAYERERANGGFFEDDSAPQAPPQSSEPEMSPQEKYEMEQQAEQIEHPFGDPGKYDGGDYEPLPEKGDPPTDSGAAESSDDQGDDGSE